MTRKIDGLLARVIPPIRSRETSFKDILGASVEGREVRHRTLDRIARELRSEFAREEEERLLPKAESNREPAVPIDPDVSALSTSPSPEARSRAAVELVRRIETFLGSDRPALALTVEGALQARVEVERTGRKQVALRIRGSRRPPRAEDVERIREELRARGIRLSSLDVS
jgi:hypothetical protein